MSGEDRSAEALRWLEFARRDLRIVAALHADPTLFTAACVHAQQAAEKSLKAVLVLHDLPVPFTHDLAYLRRLLETTSLRDLRRMTWTASTAGALRPATPGTPRMRRPTTSRWPSAPQPLSLTTSLRSSRAAA